VSSAPKPFWTAWKIGIALFVALSVVGLLVGKDDEAGGLPTSTVTYPTDESNSWFADYTPEQQTAYVSSYHYCDDAQKRYDPVAVTEYLQSRQDATQETDPTAAAEFLGCADGNSETPLAGSGIPYPSDDSYGK
jgi:hypothetical protein